MRSTAMSAPITLPTGPDGATRALGRSAAGMLDAGDFDRLAGLFPGVSSRGVAYRVRLVQRDDDATAFETEYLSQREAAAEDLMLACRMTRGIASDLLVRAACVIPTGELAAACDRALELGLATWVPETLGVHEGPFTSADVLAGHVRARLAPTHRAGSMEMFCSSCFGI